MLRFFVFGVFALLHFVSYGKEPTQKFIAQQIVKNQQYNTKIKQLSEEITQLKLKLNQQNKQIKSLQILLNTNLAKIKAATTPSITDNINVVLNKKYRQARNLMLAGQYKKAIKALNDYLNNNPNSDHTADAQFWLASSYAANGQFDHSARNYLKFTLSYPTHHKIPEALYNLGMAQHELGQPQKAILLLKSVLRRFPDHKIIPQVKESLKRLALIKKATKTL